MANWRLVQVSTACLAVLVAAAVKVLHASALVYAVVAVWAAAAGFVDGTTALVAVPDIQYGCLVDSLAAGLH